jgi:hypothetical protein
MSNVEPETPRFSRQREKQLVSSRHKQDKVSAPPMHGNINLANFAQSNNSQLAMGSNTDNM